MRPSLQKTPLAKLRATLRIHTNDKTMKRSGRSEKIYSRISRQDVANWLGCKVDNISSIESGRVKLTPENAAIIMQQTGASLQWLLGIDPTPYPINIAGRKYTQADFERAQATLKHPSLPALKAQKAFAENVGFLATILLCACKSDEIDRCESKLRGALSEILHSLSEKPLVDFSQFIDASFGFGIEDHKDPIQTLKKFYPMLAQWDKELAKIVRARITAKKTKSAS